MAARTGSIDKTLEDEIKLLGAPGKPIVDALGRVDGKTYPAQDNVPDYLKVSATKTTRVTLIKDSTLEYPTLCFRVFVQPDPAVGAVADEARFARMFARAQCRRALSVLEADLVVFSGGSDVDPQLYGETKHKSTYNNVARDNTDMQLYLMCLEHGIPMFGVCRGAQFLHVMNGGKLFQDVDGHNGDHAIWDIRGHKRIEKISSVHHQMVMPNRANGMEIIATAAQSKERWANDKNCFVGDHLDIEAFFYRDTCCIGVQGHPEYENYHYYTKWCLDLLEELVFHNPDMEWQESGNIRMKPDLVKQRLLQAGKPKEEAQVELELIQEVGL